MAQTSKEVKPATEDDKPDWVSDPCRVNRQRNSTYRSGSQALRRAKSLDRALRMVSEKRPNVESSSSPRPTRPTGGSRGRNHGATKATMLRTAGKICQHGSLKTQSC